MSAVLLVALALAPGTWIRSDPAADSRNEILLVPVKPDRPHIRDGFTRTGLWELRSPHQDFGGYSAILPLGAHRLRLFSDRGTRLSIQAPDTLPWPGRPPIRRHFTFGGAMGKFSQEYPDIEAATRNRDGGDFWLAFENFNAIARYNVGGNLIAVRQPPEMRDWPVNAGAEAMVRLADGRFIILPESHRPGLLFPSDPTQEVAAERFSFALPPPYRPTDMAQLPDGRVLILVRGLEWHLPPFTAQLWIGDPSEIRPGEQWELRRLLDLDTVLPRENYEALAIMPRDNGRVLIWIASDDNQAGLQRTLLARFSWTPPPPLPSPAESPDSQ